MQEDIPEPRPSSEHHSSSRRRTYFNLKSNIDKWDDFKNTWRNVRFDESLNSMNDSALAQFWKAQLDPLVTEKQKICILVPFQVNKNTQTVNPADKTQLGVNQKNSHNTEKLQNSKKVQQSQINRSKQNVQKQVENHEQSKTQIKKLQPEKQNKNRNNRNNFKKTQNAKVRLNPQIFQVCKVIIDKLYPQLSYVHESLYMGNEKQVLIYRQCAAIQKYLQKYRLPNNFKDVFGEIQTLIDKIFEVKVRRNEAISVFNSQEIEKSNAEFKILQLKIQDYLRKYKEYYASILEDFSSKKKVREIVLHNIRDQLKNILKEIVQKYDAAIINKYNLTDNDQFKDVLIVKKNDHRLNPLIAAEEETNKKIQYIYVQPEKQLEPPRDIRELLFEGINLQKQCYNYKIDLPRWGRENKLEGLFIRSRQGQPFYQKNINITEEIKRISIELQPYAYGKIMYDIYTWNAAGFTKSTESIVIFNQLRVPNKYEKDFRNHSIYMLGESQFGLLVDSQSTQCFKKLSLSGTNLSLANGAILCDAKGDCAGWGEMYSLSQNDTDNKEQNEDDILLQAQLNQNIKIQSPVLLLSNKQIRKVSAGMGYFLMLSSFGGIWSMGFNHFGQLGLGHFNMDAQNMNPRQITKFTDNSSPFIVDIKATECGASFALDDMGNLYRWGLDQVDETPYPIYDRFGTIINFRSSKILYKSPNPYKVSKHFIQGRVTQIQSGNQFYLALNQYGVLYGWGEAKYLGCGPLLDPADNQISDIINPKQIKSNIAYITSSSDHTVAITKDKKVLGWGNGRSFSNKLTQFYDMPVDISDQYGQTDKIALIKCGRRFTVIVSKDNSVNLIGQVETFTEKSYKFDDDVVDVQCCYENLISIVADGKKS